MLVKTVMIVINKLRIQIIIDKTLAILTVLVFLNFKGNAIAKYLSAAAKTSEIKETISDVFLKKKVIKIETMPSKIDGKNIGRQSKFLAS